MGRSRDRSPLMELQKPGYPAAMKATIEIPDELYRRFKAKSASEGRSVRVVILELMERWLEQGAPRASGAATERPRDPDVSAHGADRSPEEWLEDWFRLGEEACRNAPPGPT